VTITSTAPVVETLGPLVGGALTVTDTPLTPCWKPLRWASYWAVAVITLPFLPAMRSIEPASAAASVAPCIWRFVR
jgi:hypothetical protein